MLNLAQSSALFKNAKTIIPKPGVILSPNIRDHGVVLLAERDLLEIADDAALLNAFWNDRVAAVRGPREEDLCGRCVQPFGHRFYGRMFCEFRLADNCLNEGKC